MDPTIVTFENDRHECFSLSVFRPNDTDTTIIDGHLTPLPVLFCAHGAGMSGACFYRLARQLVSFSGDHHGEGEASAVINDEGDHRATAMPPPLRVAREAAPAGASGIPPRPVVPIASTSASAPLPPVPREQPPPVHGDLTLNALDAPIGEHVEMCVVTYDMRCHGDSTYAGGEESLTLDVLVKDFKDVLQHAKTVLFPEHQFFVLGHSVGGSVVAHGLQGDKEALRNVGGVILVDAVEGTAKLSLAHMGNFLSRRPDKFETVKQAEQWFLTNGGMRSQAGAAVSVPPLLRRTEDNHYVWKTDLHRTSGVWGTWFDGSDQAFISLPLSKMLCLASTERLDTAMTVAQMQGKFQFEVIGNECGHYVMDDATATLAAKIQRFAKRILVLTQKLNSQLKPGAPLHFNNATVPPSRAK